MKKRNYTNYIMTEKDGFYTMKKILSICLTAVLLMTMLVGCTTNADTNEKVLGVIGAME